MINHKIKKRYVKMPLTFKVKCTEFWKQLNNTSFYVNILFVFHHKELSSSFYKYHYYSYNTQYQVFYQLPLILERILEVLEMDGYIYTTAFLICWAHWHKKINISYHQYNIISLNYFTEIMQYQLTTWFPNLLTLNIKI